MKISLIAAFSLLLLVGSNLAGTAWASGSHTGDHAHDAPAIGKPSTAGQANRTVAIEMTDDMRFSPAKIAVQKGETIHFTIHNRGKLKHEFVLGTEKALKEHAELMRKFPGMEHAEDNMVSVAPGQSGDVIWRFTHSGKVLFACLQPGHYDAGMKGVVAVDRKTIKPTVAGASR
jgi:uncharacterized cupredoxin-like copper-binding protein